MRKIIFSLILVFICLIPSVSAEMTAEVNPSDRSVTISGQGTYVRGDIVKLLFLKPGATAQELDEQTVSATDAICYIKEVKTGTNQFSFPAFKLPLTADFGEYTAYLIYKNDVTELSVPYISSAQVNTILSDTNEANSFVWILENFSEELNILESDLNKLKTLDKDGKKYFASAYILGQGFENMDSATFQAAFTAKLNAYLNERPAIALTALNQADSAGAVEKALKDYNDIFGINFDDTAGLASLSAENRSEVYDRISRISLDNSSNINTVLQQQIALQKIEIGPWGTEESLLNQYQSILNLDLSVLNRINDKEKVYRALVGQEILSGVELQQLLAELSTPAPIPQAPRPVGGGGGGGGAIQIEPAVTPVAPQTPAEESNEFQDLQEVSWAKEAIYSLQKSGVLNGKTNTLFCPSENVTRAEFAKMIVLAFSLNSNGEISQFNDVSGEFWAKNYIDIAWNNNIINGYNGSFLPNSNITREDMAVMIYRLFNNSEVISQSSFADEQHISDYAKPAVSYLSEHSVISGKGDNYFCPKLNATRAEAAVMIYQALNMFN